MRERRQQEAPADLAGYLEQMPALVLLNRLPTPMLGVSPSGEIAYANPACAEMLGYPDGETVTRLHLPDLLIGHHESAPAECVEPLRNTDQIVGWNHALGYAVRTMMSRPLLVRDSDPLVLVSMIDVTNWLWETNRASGTLGP